MSEPIRPGRAIRYAEDDPIRKAVQEVQKDLLTYPGVLSIGVGLRMRERRIVEPTEICISVLVKYKSSTATPQLPREITTSYGTFPVDVICTGGGVIAA